MYEELDWALEKSQRLLPPTAKKFQEWDVGLLERFDLGDVGKATNVNDIIGGLESLGVD